MGNILPTLGSCVRACHFRVTSWEMAEGIGGRRPRGMREVMQWWREMPKHHFPEGLDQELQPLRDQVSVQAAAIDGHRKDSKTWHVYTKQKRRILQFPECGMWMQGRIHHQQGPNQVLRCVFIWHWPESASLHTFLLLLKQKANLVCTIF